MKVVIVLYWSYHGESQTCIMLLTATLLVGREQCTASNVPGWRRLVLPATHEYVWVCWTPHLMTIISSDSIPTLYCQTAFSLRVVAHRRWAYARRVDTCGKHNKILRPLHDVHRCMSGLDTPSSVLHKLPSAVHNISSGSSVVPSPCRHRFQRTPADGEQPGI